MKKLPITILLILLMISVININSSKVIDTTAFIANSVYELNFVTSVVWWRKNPDVTDFLKTFNGSSVIVPITKGESSRVLKINKSVGYNQTVFFATAPEQFAYWIRLVNQNIVTPIRVVLAITTPIMHPGELTKYTRTAWKQDVGDIVIICSHGNEENITLWTYYPYSDGKCGDYTPIYMNYSTNAKKLFPKKFTNFYKCPVKATVLNYPPYTNITYYQNGTIKDVPGLDGDAYKILLKTLNATMEIVSVTWHSGFTPNSNSSSPGTYQQLITRKADFSVPTGILNYKRYAVAQLSPVFQSAIIKWVGPNRREIYAWARVLLPFYTTITPFLCLSFCTFIAVTTLVKKLKTTSKTSVTFQAFAIFLGQEVNFITGSALTNSLFVLWVWFTLVVRIGYQGDLVDGLQKVILEPPLGHLEDAIKIADGYGGVAVFRDYYSVSLQNYTVLQFHELHEYIKKIHQGMRFIMIVDNILVQLNNVHLQALDEMASRLLGCMHMRPAWPASRDINLRIQEIVENGLFVKLNKDYVNKWKIYYKYSANDDVVPEPLGMATLAALFYGLAVTWLICSLICIIENIYFWYIQDCMSNRNANRLRHT